MIEKSKSMFGHIDLIYIIRRSVSLYSRRQKKLDTFLNRRKIKSNKENKFWIANKFYK